MTTLRSFLFQDRILKTPRNRQHHQSAGTSRQRSLFHTECTFYVFIKHYFFFSQRSVVAGNVETALAALIRNLGESFSSLVSLQFWQKICPFKAETIVVYHSLGTASRHSTVSRENFASYWRFFKVH
jgi:hypothetical protein